MSYKDVEGEPNLGKLVHKLALAVEDGTVYDSVIGCKIKKIAGNRKTYHRGKIRIAANTLGKATISVSMEYDTKMEMDDEEIVWEVTKGQGDIVDVMRPLTWTTGQSSPMNYPAIYHAYDPAGIQK